MNQLSDYALPGTCPDPRYPDSDGRFMGDTDYHNIAMIWLAANNMQFDTKVTIEV